MLKKLCSHEWKDTWFINTLVCAIVCALTVIIIIAMMTPAFPKMFGPDQSGIEFFSDSMLTMFTFTMYFFSIWACIMVVRYYFFYRYYKNLFTDQGYLMHTLPVRKTDLIHAKLIIGTIWQYISFLVVALSILLCVGIGAYRINLLEGSIDPGFFSFIGHSISEAWKSLAELGADFMPTFICIIIACLLAPAAELLFFYVAIDLGQLSRKNRLMISILILVGLNIVRSFVSNIIVVPFMVMVGPYPTRSDINIIAIVVLLFLIVISAALYIINKYMVEKRLNLE